MKKCIFLLAVSLFVHGCAQMGPVRSGVITIKGVPYETVGTRVQVGQSAPEFAALDGDFKPVALSQFRGQPILISAVPSLETKVCTLQTKHFNDSLAKLPAGVVILTVSMDLPGTQKRFCSEEHIEGMHVLSDSARREFGTRYGVLIAERGLLARSVFVVGRDGRLVYSQIVPELSSQPDYDAALEAIRTAAKPPSPGDAQ